MATQTQKTGTTDKYRKYDELFLRAVHAADAMKLYKLRCEEFTFNDVDGTLSQFNKKQKDTIRRQYDIPISSKIAFPIIEQLTSMLTATQPFPRLIATTEEIKEFVAAYEGAYQATWYECKGNTQLRLAIRDALVTGSGFLHTRKASLLSETTFGVVLEHVSWKHVWIDPDTRKEDLSDARYAIIAELITRERAEDDYDMEIRNEDLMQHQEATTNLEQSLMYAYPTEYNKDKDYVWVRRFYEYEIVNIYVSDEGLVSLKKPKPIEIPNPEKEALKTQIQGKLEGFNQTNEALKQVEDNITPLENAPATQQDLQEEGKALTQQATQDTADDMIDIADLTRQYEAMPNTIEVFEFILENGQTVQVKSFERLKDKRVRETEMVGRRILSSEIVPSLDKIPLHHLTNSQNGNINLTYGIVHYIMDLIKAINKVFAMTIKDMQTNGNRKVLLAKGSVLDINAFEQKWSSPSSANEYIPNPSIPDGGRPTVVEPSPINQSYTYLLDKFQSLIEYTTGINSMTTGNPQGETPTTYGVAQQMASFGTQRIKLYARNLESPLEDLAETTIAYLNAYADRNKVAQYFDTEGNLQTAQIIDDGTVDLRFKVRVDVGSNLPTTRQMFAQMLALVSGQTKNPQVADQLTKVLLENIDMPAADKLAKQIDQITQLSQQIEQAQEEIKKLQGENDSLKFNLEQTQISAKVKEEAQKIITEMKLDPEKAQEVMDMKIKTNGEAGNPLTNYLEGNQAPQEGAEMPPEQMQQEPIEEEQVPF